ncbi:MAG: hypothetical protein A3H79_00995 [Candidatus Levybacteria bacterium RIFCSPLOWO2_02_FULL_36_8b]|nr:MAG: hypothetical protein A3H79_00995 [Candidatus Levybacteria bacterium RIFCSPLOWO2_02_FULL_36_8b]
MRERESQRSIAEGITHLPVTIVIDGKTPTASRIEALWKRFFNNDGTANEEVGRLRRPLVHAREYGKDVVMIHGGTGTHLVVGEHIAEDKRFIDPSSDRGRQLLVEGAIAAGLLAAGAIGVVLYRHHKDSSKPK